MLYLTPDLGLTNPEQRQNLDVFLRDLEHHKTRTFRSLHAFTAVCESLATYLVLFFNIHLCLNRTLMYHPDTEDLRCRLCHHPILARSPSPHRHHGCAFSRSVRMGRQVQIPAMSTCIDQGLLPRVAPYESISNDYHSSVQQQTPRRFASEKTKRGVGGYHDS